ncbi:MAG: hypothetical protein JWO82_3713 [Akkermansiaceae bacterium]|nr:hypothetical protein [Akkermansiaceae bacterium]
MSDAPEEEVPKAAKTARKRPAKRVTKSAPATAAAETVVNLSAPEPLVPAPAGAEKSAAPRQEAPSRREAAERSESSEPDERPERSERSHSQRSTPDFSDHGDPVATFGEPPSADSQGGGKKRRRRKKNKHGQQPPQGGGGGSQQVFQTAPTQGYAVAAPASFQEPREAPHVEPVSGPAPAMHAAPRPKLDSDQIAKKAWKIFLAEVSEEGLALIGDNDARELSRRSFRLAEVFVEEAARRQHR